MLDAILDHLFMQEINNLLLESFVVSKIYTYHMCLFQCFIKPKAGTKVMLCGNLLKTQVIIFLFCLVT